MALMLGGVFLWLACAGCALPPAGSEAPPTARTLRVGTAQIELDSLVQNITLEALVKIGPDGRVRPWLAKDVRVSPDGHVLKIETRPDVRFHDGSPVTTGIIADILRATLPRAFLAGEDVTDIAPASETEIHVSLREPSRFALEALEDLIRKPGSQTIGTGPFAVADSEAAEVRADKSYYLGPPSIDAITIQMYPSVRAAWAEMLRNNLDMVYDVGLDALDSLHTSTTIDVFSYTRNYQYVVLFNTKTAALQPAALRRALNQAVDRPALIRDALNGRGVASSGPIWPGNWAAGAAQRELPFDPEAAVAEVRARGGKVSFRCLVAPEDETVALVLKRQLAAVGIDVIFEEASIEAIRDARASLAYEAILTTAINGPSLFRTSSWWHSKGPRNNGRYANPRVDAALDTIRRALTDDDYRRGVEEFQQAVLENPPAMFLAWNQRARAVSHRFRLPPTEPNIDVLGSLRLWQPVEVEAVSIAN
jgi:peptide/nickel transport system substrate-binding protein